MDTAALKVEVQVLAELDFREIFPVSGLKRVVLPLCAFVAWTFVMIEWGGTLVRWRGGRKWAHHEVHE